MKRCQMKLERRPENEQMVQRYEKLVRPTESSAFQLIDTNDDPLIHWLSYIKFYQDSFPSDTQSQFLLFERCMRSLYRIQKYANDTRFVRVCCRYAGQTERSSEVFQHLYQQKIGTELAMFWIAWSFVCEKQGDFQFAKKILEKGIRKHAKPLNKLEARFQQFQRRMASHWLNATQTGDDDAIDVDGEEEQESRGVLSSLSEDAVRRNDRRRLQQQMQGRPLSSQATFVDRTNTHHDDETPNTNNNRGGQSFAIFVDEGENRHNDQSRLLDESSLFPLDRPIEREEDRRKENTMERERWNERGAYASSYDTHYARPRPAAQPLPPFAIHVDKACAEENAKQEAESVRAQNEMRRLRDERTFRERNKAGMVETLQEDPLRYMRDPSRFQEDQATEVIDRRSRKDRDLSNDEQNLSKKEARRTKRRAAGYQHKLLKSVAGQEQSFEEARAKACFFALVDASTNFHYLPLHSQPLTVEDSAMSMDQSDVSMAQEDRNHPYHMEPTEQDNRDEIAPPIPTPRNASTASSTVDDAAATGAPECRIEQTINTQMAIRELSMMFSSPAMDTADPSKGPPKRSGGLGPLMNLSGESHGDPMPSIEERPDGDAIDNPTFEEFGDFSAAADSSFARVHGSPTADDIQRSPKKDLTPAQPFKIHIDEEIHMDTNAVMVESKRQSFKIYTEESCQDNVIQEDSKPNPPREASVSFVSLRREAGSRNKCVAAMATRSNEASEFHQDTTKPREFENADTATFSVFEECQLLEEEGGGETASLGSLVEELNGENDSFRASK